MRAFAASRTWIEASSPGLLAVAVGGAPVDGASWGALAGVAAGGPWALPVATVVTAWGARAWGWPVALALLANWFSWVEGTRARGAAVALWALLGWTAWAPLGGVEYRGGEKVMVLAGVGLAANLVVGVLFVSRRRRMRRLPTFSVVLLLCLALPGVVWAQDPDPQPGDVIFFEGFEGFQGFDQRVADGWGTWSAPGSHLPEYKQANPDAGGVRPYPYRVHGGDNAQQYFTVYRVHDAGLVRQISAPPFATVEVSAWAETWTGDHDDPYHSDAAQNARVRVGVDPAGGVNPGAPTVVWGAEINPLSAWQPLPPVQGQVGESGLLTIFLRSSPVYALKHNDVYWDDVQVTLVAVGQAPPAAGGGGGAGLAAAPPPDPILDGLVASPQRTPQSGGWEALLPALLVTGVVGGSHLRRRGR
jgi:hypothetical protein